MQGLYNPKTLINSYHNILYDEQGKLLLKRVKPYHNPKDPTLFRLCRIIS